LQRLSETRNSRLRSHGGYSIERVTSLSRTSILVFGASGQLGSELVSRAKPNELTFHFARRADAYIDDALAVRRALQMSRPSLVINAAAYTNVDGAEVEQESAFRGNADGPRVLAIACTERKIPLVHVSTHYVFDGRKQSPYVENDEAAPINVYGRSKLAGEMAIKAVTDQYLILRTSWLFGAYRQNFLKTTLRLAAERDEIRMVADQHGNPTATADVADALFAAIPRVIIGTLIGGTYHVAGANVATWYDLTSEIVLAAAPYTGRCPKVVPISTQDYPTRARRPLNCELDASKFMAATGFVTADWRQRVHETVALLMDGRGALA
jgi:dTDP-4-dehydrorhamnose reductase